MKKFLLLTFFGCSLFDSHAQGTLSFTANLTNPAIFAVGTGAFSLTGDLFAYDVISPFAFDIGAIHGPAVEGMDAPVIFDLRRVRCVAPHPDGTPGYCEFTGSFRLSEQQVTQLTDELWYVTATSGLEVRGQITLIPEPSILWIFALCVSVCGVSRIPLRRVESRRSWIP